MFTKNFASSNVFISKIEMKTIKTALENHDWVVAVQCELAKSERNKLLEVNS